MTEAEVRKCHRLLGMIMVWFLAGQTLTGLALSVASLAGYTSGLTKTAGVLHFNWDPVGTFYRVLLAAATLAQGISGLVIYLKTRQRQKKQ